MKQLLIVSNCPAQSTLEIQHAVAAGAKHKEITGVNVVVKEPLDTHVDDVLNADGLLLGTTENFGAMSGFDQGFYGANLLSGTGVKTGNAVCLIHQGG